MPVSHTLMWMILMRIVFRPSVTIYPRTAFISLVWDTTPNPLDPDEEKSSFYVAHIKKVIAAASKLKVGVVNTFIGRDPSRNVAYNLDRFTDVWPEIIQYADGHGVKVAIEKLSYAFHRRRVARW